MTYYMQDNITVNPFDDNDVFDTGAGGATAFTLTNYRTNSATETVSAVVSFHTDRAMDPVTLFRISNVDIGNLKSPVLKINQNTPSFLAVPAEVTGIFCLGWGGGGGGGGGGYDSFQFGETNDNGGDGGSGGGSGAVGGFYLNTNQNASYLTFNVGGGGAGGDGGPSPAGQSGTAGDNGGSTNFTLYNTSTVSPSFVSVTIGGGRGGGGGIGGGNGGSSVGGAGGTVPSTNWPASPHNFSASGTKGTDNAGSNTGSAGGGAVAYGDWYTNHPFAPFKTGDGGRGGNGDPGPTDNGSPGTDGTRGHCIVWFYYDGVNRMV